MFHSSDYFIYSIPYPVSPSPVLSSVPVSQYKTNNHPPLQKQKTASCSVWVGVLLKSKNKQVTKWTSLNFLKWPCLETPRIRQNSLSGFICSWDEILPGWRFYEIDEDRSHYHRLPRRGRNRYIFNATWNKLEMQRGVVRLYLSLNYWETSVNGTWDWKEWCKSKKLIIVPVHWSQPTLGGEGTGLSISTVFIQFIKSKLQGWWVGI